MADPAGFEPQPEAEEICPLESEQMMAEHTQLVDSSEIHDQLIGTAWFGKLLSEPDPPVQDVVAAGVLPRFVDFLQNSSSAKLQIEAAWVLLKSAQSDNFVDAIDAGVVPALIHVISCTDGDLLCVCCQLLEELSQFDDHGDGDDEFDDSAAEQELMTQNASSPATKDQFAFRVMDAV
eukprot:SAG31_NODE_6533_length_1986_cov_1.269210_1_plen_177_part_10